MEVAHGLVKARIIFLTAACLLGFTMNYAQVKHPYASDQPMPIPKKFEIPATSVAQSITFTSDGREFYFVTEGDGRIVIKYSSFSNGVWSIPKVAEFCGQYSVETPYLSPEGNKIFFTQSGTNGGICTAEKTANGWGASKNIGSQINSAGWNFSPAIASNGSIYFNSNRSGRNQIYFSTMLNGKFSSPQKLPDNINNYNVQEIFVARDESYILFGNYVSDDNPGDIFISFRYNGSWTQAIGLGKKINTNTYEGRPCVSPDGNYLFFTKHVNQGPSIYQVDWKSIIDSLKDVSMPTGVEKTNLRVPNKLLLNQNYPNPFNPETNIGYQLPINSFVTLKVFDSLGREIATLVNENQDAGLYEIKFNGNNLTSGIYFTCIKAGKYYENMKMILLR